MLTININNLSTKSLKIVERFLKNKKHSEKSAFLILIFLFAYNDFQNCHNR